MENIKSRLDALNRRLELSGIDSLLFSRSLQDDDFLLKPLLNLFQRSRLQREKEILKKGEEILKEVYVFLDELCSFYLQAMPEQREELRTLLGQVSDKQLFGDSSGSDKHLLYEAIISSNRFNEYTSRAIWMLTKSGDEIWLRRGLLLVSFEGTRMDYRDSLLALGVLYLASVKVGIDPLPVFQAIAEISGTQAVGSANCSPRDFLADFHSSAFFEGVKRGEEPVATDWRNIPGSPRYFAK